MKNKEKNPKIFKIKRICMYCKKILGYKDSMVNLDTHGMCKKCSKEKGWD